MFDTLLTTPAIAWLLLGCLLVEAILLLAIWKKKLVGLPPMQTIAFLGAGASFAIALGVALSGAPSHWLGLALLSAFVFHAVDIYLRWTP